MNQTHMGPCHLPLILFWVYMEMIILILEAEDRFASLMELGLRSHEAPITGLCSLVVSGSPCNR